MHSRVMSRRRNQKSNLLAECINQSNTIDFVQNIPSISSEMGAPATVIPGVLEGPPAFLEAQGIRYIPAPLETECTTPISESLSTVPVTETLCAPMSSLQLQERIDSTVRKCLESQALSTPMHQPSHAIDTSYNESRIKRIANLFDSPRSSRLSTAYDTPRSSRLSTAYDTPRSSRLSTAYDNPRCSRLSTAYDTPHSSGLPTPRRRMNLSSPMDICSDEEDYNLRPLRSQTAITPVRELAPRRCSTRMAATYDSPPRSRHMQSRTSIAPPTQPMTSSFDNDDSHKRLKRLHAEIMASTPSHLRKPKSLQSEYTNDDDHKRLKQLHADIMASTPPSIRNKVLGTAAKLDSGWDSDDQICNVVRPSRRTHW